MSIISKTDAVNEDLAIFTDLQPLIGQSWDSLESHPKKADPIISHVGQRSLQTSNLPSQPLQPKVSLLNTDEEIEIILSELSQDAEDIQSNKGSKNNKNAKEYILIKTLKLVYDIYTGERNKKFIKKFKNEDEILNVFFRSQNNKIPTDRILIKDNQKEFDALLTWLKTYFSSHRAHNVKEQKLKRFLTLWKWQENNAQTKRPADFREDERNKKFKNSRLA